MLHTWIVKVDIISTFDNVAEKRTQLKLILESLKTVKYKLSG
jgi:hypothetical protein